ncbi:MAG: hypothetical protein H8F28_21190 [Fibrella sp.]|nr:hypothetical protein [Armatimonadota bacterium]
MPDAVAEYIARGVLYVGVHAGAATDAPDAARIAGAVYRSQDDGVTWETITSPEKGGPVGESSPLRMRIAPDGTAYVTYNGTGTWDKGGTGGGVWKYAGGTWRDVTPTQAKNKPFCGINLHPKNPRKILCATTYSTDGTIYYSENAGETWREYRYDKNDHEKGTLVLGDIPAWERGPGHSWGGNGSDVAFDPVDPSVVYFTSFSGPYVGTGLDTDRMRFSLLGDGREQMTTASGVSPTKGAPFVSGVWDVGGFRHEDFDKIPDTRFLVRDKQGAAFTGYDTYRNGFQDTFDMDASPKMPDVIVAAGGWQWNMTGTAVVSRDNGRSFREFAAKPTPDAKFGRVAVSATDADNIVWVPMNNGKDDRQPVYFTRDGGKTWDAGSGSPVGMINGDGPWTFFKPLAADREAAHTFYLYDRRDGGFFVSEDGGANWGRRATLPTQPGNHFDNHQLVAAPGRSGDLWLSLYEKGLLHSTDSGKTWSRLTGVEWSVRAALGKPAPGSQTPTVFLFGQIGGTPPKDDVSVDAALYRSVDSGKSWTRINPATHGLNGINPLIADMQVFGRVYVGTGGRGFFYGEPLARTTPVTASSKNNKRK